MNQGKEILIKQGKTLVMVFEEYISKWTQKNKKKHMLIPKINFPATQTSPVTHIKQLQGKLQLFNIRN